MKLGDLSDVAQIAGAVGVIVSLIYLAGGPRCKPVHNRRVVGECYEFTPFLHSFEW
jgi:hypothetical protein